MPVNVVIPSLGDSVSEAVLIKWHKNDGDTVARDEAVCELETDKANVDVPSPAAGVLRRVKDEGDTVQIGEIIGRVDESAAGAAPAEPVTSTKKAEATEKQVVVVAADDRGQDKQLSPAVRRMVEEEKLDADKIAATGPGGRITKEDVVKHLDQPAKPAATEKTPEPESIAVPSRPAPDPSPAISFDADGIKRVPMTKIRKKIAERLVAAQHTAAILTTFNEIDLQNVMDIRTRYKEKFEKTKGVGLGFMSFFCKAVVMAIKDYPMVNAQIDGDDVVYHEHVNMGIAVSTDRGLAVPVLREVEKMSFAQIESEIKRLATATRDGKLGVEEMSGGTFTITNGGVFGSLLSTPIINMPQAAILGMHTIQKRPVVINDKIEIRPMMYVALSYDHRLVDGRQSVTFLVRIKELLEDPARLMLEI